MAAYSQSPSRDHSQLGLAADRIGPDDPRYAVLVRRGFNKRFVSRPDYIRLVYSTEQVVEAVQEAVQEDLRVAARSGGHCLEGFVADPAVRVIIDTSLMTGVFYDREKDAFAVDAGTTVGESYRRLFLGWGVVLPAGESPDIGMGGHVLGGAFGFLCREHGLAADYLYAVEVVVVDAAGKAKAVVATREPSDPNRDLWWAHTGGGGGNFGIVTRYWFRSPAAERGNPSTLLPKAPDSIAVFRAAWNWTDIGQDAFTRLARNFGDWAERNSEPGSPAARVFSTLFLHRQQYGKLELKGLSTAGAGAEALIDEHMAAITDGVGASPAREVEHLSWLTFALRPFPELFVVGMDNVRFKGKDAFLRKRFTDHQLDVAYKYMISTDYDVPGGMMGLATYGGRVNVVPPDANASPQRDSILTTSCAVGWGSPGDEATSLAWVRGLYRDLFAETGGVPAPSPRCDGAMINHPDADLADPALNTSGVPWSTLYYKDNYPRLQQIKARWDPRNVFQHALSIRPPAR
jgi:aclacinomycin oxidase